MNPNIPSDLSPEAAAWLQAQIAIRNASTAVILRAEIHKVDSWANGIFVALRDALGNQLGDAPLIGAALSRSWSKAAHDFDRMMEGDKPVHHAGESLEQLEARSLLYRFYVKLGMMPEVRRA